jgi:hypothetical protein
MLKTKSQCTKCELWYLDTAKSGEYSNLSAEDRSILIDYYKGQKAIEKLNNGHGYLKCQYGIVTDLPMATAPKEPPIVRRKIAHSGTKIKLTAEMERATDYQLKQNGYSNPYTSKQVYNICPQCQERMHSWFAHSSEMQHVRDEDERGCLIQQYDARVSYTIFHCDCGFLEVNKGNRTGAYLEKIDRIGDYTLKPNKREGGKPVIDKFILSFLLDSYCEQKERHRNAIIDAQGDHCEDWTGDRKG